MDRFRFGLSGLGGPLTEKLLYGAPVGDRLAAYGRRFGVFEAACATHRDFGAAEAQALLDRLPRHVQINLRLAVGPTARPRDAWLAAARPILLSDRNGPIHVPWPGARDDGAERLLDAFLSSLWPALPGRQRLAVEFQDPSWLRAPVMHMLEDHGAAVVWSSRAGNMPYRVTTDHIYVRLTGPTRRILDEVVEATRRIVARPDDERPVSVVSPRHLDPYGVAVLERFAERVGRPLAPPAPTSAPLSPTLRPPSRALVAPHVPPAPTDGQRSLDGYATRTA